MKKIVIAVGFVLLSVAGLYGCGREREFSNVTADDLAEKALYLPVSDDETLSPTGGVSVEDESSDSPQLTALVDTLEEAQQIADLYGIELDSYSYGVASYHTDKDISELIKLGEESGYPTLAPNYKYQLNTAQ